MLVGKRLKKAQNPTEQLKSTCTDYDLSFEFML